MHTGSSVSAGKSCTLSLRIEAREDPYFESEDEDLDDDDDEECHIRDDEYWDLDELGVDLEEFYDLCRNCTSLKP